MLILIFTLSISEEAGGRDDDNCQNTDYFAPIVDHMDGDSDQASSCLRLRGGYGTPGPSAHYADDVWPHDLDQPHTLNIDVRLDSRISINIFSIFQVGVY